MSDDQRPLARVDRQREHNHDRWHLFVAERFVASEPVGDVLGEPEILADIAAAINAAVESREAKLRACLTEIRDVLLPVVEDRKDAGHYSSAVRAHAAALFALEGHGNQYAPGDWLMGLAFDLGAAQATIRALSLIADAVTAERADAIAPFLGAMGLRREDPAESLSWVRDDDLRAECSRRGIDLSPPRNPYNLFDVPPVPARTFGYGPIREAMLRQDQAAAEPQTPLGALMHRLDMLNIRYDAARLNSDRDYYEAAQDAVSAAVPPLAVRIARADPDPHD